MPGKMLAYDALTNKSALRDKSEDCILVHAKMLDRLVGVLTADKHQVKVVIVIQRGVFEKAQAALSPLGISVYTFDDLIARGRNTPVQLPNIVPADIYYVCYSSGTTGTPKGVIITHAAMTSNIFANRGGLGTTEIVTHYSFFPFAHLFERMMTGGVCACGGREMMATGGFVVNITVDLKELKPSTIASVTRIFIQYYTSFIKAIEAQPKWKQMVFWGSSSVKWYFQSRHYPRSNHHSDRTYAPW
jgi:long-chain acyl-CoA synthetase